MLMKTNETIKNLKELEYINDDNSLTDLGIDLIAGTAAVPADRSPAGWITGQRKADPAAGDNRGTERAVPSNPVPL